MTDGRFAVIGDLQETSRLEFWREDNSKERDLIVRRVADEKPSFVVLLGDLVFDGSSPRHWKRFDALVAPIREARVPMLPILGNHDYWWGKSKNLRHYLVRFPEVEGNRWHRRRFESLELVFLDSNAAAQTEDEWNEQLGWFSRTLEGADADPSCRGTVVFVHHPPFTNSAVTRGNEVVRRCFVEPFVRANKTRIMLSGHVHSYERFEHEGKTFVVSGGGGGPRVRLVAEQRSRHRNIYRPTSSARRPCHYLSMVLSASSLSIEAIGLERGCRSFDAMETFDLTLRMIFDLELNAASHYPPRGVVDLGPEIERAGFEAFWKGEADSPDPFALLTGLAVTTKSLKLGTAIVHIHARTAVTLGVQSATLQEISGGRFWLGVGVANQRIASWHGAKLERPLESARRYLERARRVAEGQRDESTFALGWKPQHPRFPTFLAALGPKMSRLSGEVSDGAIVNMGTPEKLAEIAAQVREGARAAGKDEKSVQIIAKVRVSIDPDRDRARAGLRRLAAMYTVADHYRDMLVSSGFEGEVAKASAAAAEGGLRSAAQAIDDGYLDRLPLLAATSIEEVVDRLRPFEACGATRIILPYVPATDAPIDEARRFLDAWRAVKSP